MNIIKSQRDLKREIYRKQSKLTDEMLFSSKAYAAYQASVTEGCTKNYGKSCKVYLEAGKSDDPAYTDGFSVHINLNNDYIEQNTTRREKDHIYTGLNLHECGHLLYTDFQLLQKASEKLVKENTLYPLPEESSERDDTLLWLIRNDTGKIVAKLYHSLDNCIEDGHIEKRVMKAVPGYAPSLAYIRKWDDDHAQSVFEMRKAGLDNLSIVITMTLRYAQFCRTSFGDVEKDDEAVTAFLKIRPYIDEAVNTTNAVLRKKAVNECFVRIFHFIIEEIEKKNQKKGQNQNNQNANHGHNLVNGQENKKLNDQNNSNGEKAQLPTKEAIKSVLDNLSESLERLQDKTERKNVNQIFPVSDDIKMSGDGGAKVISSSGCKMDSLLESVEKKAAIEYVAAEQEKALEREFSQILSSVKRDNAVHRNIPFSLRRADITTSALEDYVKEHSELDAIARKVMKNLLKDMEERRRGDTLNGLFMGRRMDTAHLYRQDRKIFSRNILPENVPNMAIELLVDLSGSMSGEGISVARKCAYITWSFCQMAGIPIGVTGHHCFGDTVVIESFADPYSLDNRDGERIFSMDASGCNRDGYAVRYCLKRLLKFDADDKIMMVISDGCPNHMGYGIFEGKADLQDAVAKARKEGILTVTAAIGSDADTVRYVYTDGITEKKAAMFLEISDLERLPKTFVKLIKKHLE